MFPDSLAQGPPSNLYFRKVQCNHLGFQKEQTGPVVPDAIHNSFLRCEPSMVYQGKAYIKVVLGEERREKNIILNIWSFIFLHILAISHLDTLQLNIWCV